MWIVCLVWTHYAYYYLLPFFVLYCFVLSLSGIGHSCKKAKNVINDESLNHLHIYAITWPDISLGNTLKFLDHKDNGNFSGSGKRIFITMTTAWRCVPCQRMRLIQITQWSGSRAWNLLAKIEYRCGWLRWREWQIVWPLREHTRVRQYPPAVTAIKISALLPGAILTSKSGERLDRPQPGLT